MEVIKKKMNNMKAKLEEAECAACQAEAELNECLEKTDDLKNELEELEVETGELEDEQEEKDSRLSHLVAQYESAEKTTEENRRAHAELSNRGKIDLSSQTRLEDELAQLLASIDENEDKYATLSDEVDSYEAELDEAEQQVHDLDARVKELEVDSVNVGNTLRSQQINEEKASKSHDSSVSKLELLKNKLAEIEDKVEHYEEMSNELEAKYEEKDEILEEKKKEHAEVTAEFENLMAELNDI